MGKLDIFIEKKVTFFFSKVEIEHNYFFLHFFDLTFHKHHRNH